MKKTLGILILTMVLCFAGCSSTESKKLNGVGIPSHVSYIAFNNGGTTMLEAENAEVSILVQQDRNLILKDPNKIQFYVYRVKGKIRMLRQDGSIRTTENGEIEIVDSEALSIQYIK
jgi:hypothetical protein